MSSPFAPSAHDSLLLSELSEGITHYRFQRTEGWETAHPANSETHAMLSLMKDEGAFTVVRIANARTSTISPSSGVDISLRIIRDLKGPFVAINGGFFIHLTKLFRAADGSLLPDDKVTQTVGPSSATEHSGKYVEVHSAYADLLKKREMTDKSFFVTGPSLGQPLLIEPPTFNQLNSPAGRFNYFAIGPDGNKIASPVWASLTDWDKQRLENSADPNFQTATTMRTHIEDDYLEEAMKRVTLLSSGELGLARAPPANEFVKSFWAQVPGNLSHVTEPNERAGVFRGQDAWYFFAYNSLRAKGLTMNEFGTLTKKFVALSGNVIATDDDIWANDGGPSICILYVDGHSATRLLAQGGLLEQSANIPVDPDTMRKLPNMIAAWPQGVEEEA